MSEPDEDPPPGEPGRESQAGRLGPGERETTEAARGGGDALAPTCVEIVVGPSRRVYDIAAQGELVIGRSAAATVMVDDERVSRRHLRIGLRDGALVGEDLGSRNGTLLNGRRLEGERRLRGGDELELGPVRIRAGGARRASELLDEGELSDRLDEEVERARAFGRPLAVVGITLDGPHRAVDDAVARIAGRLGTTDIAGEYASGRLLVLLPERQLRAAQAIARSLAALGAEVAAVKVSSLAAGPPEVELDADALVSSVFGSTRGGDEERPARSLVLADASMRELFETARRVARSMATVLVHGETGAGKELVAGEIHAASPRGGGPYVRINCAALPETLIESELFGHERGAFTGADRRRIGRIESAGGGTVFLDEVGELPLGMQAKLLHVLEDRRVVHLGSNEPVAVDVRFVVATNRDLEREVREGRFREDLYYRLSAITLEVPPLRERPLDLVALADHFCVEASREAGIRTPRMSAGFRAALGSYPWPGNVRELKNVIDRAVVLADGDELTTRQLPDRLRNKDLVPPAGGPMKQQVEETERRTLETALAETDGNRTHAARKLGISRRALIYKLNKFGLGRKR